MAGNFSESDEDYVNSTVLEAGNLFTQICLKLLLSISFPDKMTF